MIFISICCLMQLKFIMLCQEEMEHIISLQLQNMKIQDVSPLPTTPYSLV